MICPVPSLVLILLLNQKSNESCFHGRNQMPEQFTTDARLMWRHQYQYQWSLPIWNPSLFKKKIKYLGADSCQCLWFSNHVFVFSSKLFSSNPSSRNVHYKNTIKLLEHLLQIRTRRRGKNSHTFFVSVFSNSCLKWHYEMSVTLQINFISLGK